MTPSLLQADKVLVIDFGSQVTHLICRRIRELGAYSELISCKDSNLKDKILNQFQPKAIILSGGPSSVYEDEAPHLPKDLWTLFYDQRIPVLGICYGLQEMMWALGGKVEQGQKREFGYAELKLEEEEINGTSMSLFKGMKNGSQIWMSHGDKVTQMAPGFQISGVTANSEFAAVSNLEKNFFGVQFHPEVSHTIEGKTILKNFLIVSFENEKAYTSSLESDSNTNSNVTKPQTKFSFSNWTMSKFYEEEVVKIRSLIKDDEYVLGGVSGGVDSSVGAALVHKAIGSRFHPFLIDSGLLRKDEAKEVQERLNRHIPGIKMHCLDASEEFYTALKGITEPERKRKTIGKLFIDCFERAIKESGLPIEKTYLLQGTLYPDVIESTSFKGPSSVIKSHHNVGGLPERLNFKGLLEPLRLLFKDEVRSLGRELGLPEESVIRHPFPGPGLAIRIVGGEITRERADVLREADHIFITELKQAGPQLSNGSNSNGSNGLNALGLPYKSAYEEIGQAFVTLLPEVKTVGVMGDSRTYEMTCCLRAIQSSDFMTANCYPIPHELLNKISNRIINEVRGINRVCYDCSSKPPATIEWE